ncbi:family 20 glycosylhydrolase [Pseudoxanthomonas helianthi]|uniref:beta-N-acetylhexosaminidase n=1 Tax=Pseudoxanthomonas helianthi TaxID=1453541 RepID=A0A941AT32_9GAMM|nr:family 20 glycosylhydrolase [Pseudoxanthomonas helianthi]MBP3983537.1 family 20 glycosylhydrolase [Pseudoxanthomonas helianthi]
MRRILFALLCFSPALSYAQATTSQSLGLLPQPEHVELREGRFQPAAEASVSVSGVQGAEARDLGELATSILHEAWDVPVKAQRGDKPATLSLQLRPDAQANSEGYSLEVDAQGLRLSARTAAGLFYGLQTLRQLAKPGSREAGIPALRIDDAPRFGYRGLMLDSARHMQPLDYIKRHLDLMARYKFNTLHWHLTDDQGWRLEIKRFPKLAKISAYRKETIVGRNFDPYVGDGKPYGGYYTQAQAREIVEYAKQRHITVIPEIDMPGHMVAALAAYPELGCTPGPFETLTIWGVSDDVLCPSEQTFAFVTGVLAEVMQVFPSKYVHVGGDEAPVVRWQQSALAQEIIRREKLKDEHALQGWFLRRVEKFVNANGRKIIGWDEILDGTPSRTATVMSWRGMAGGIKAAQLGHDVVMSPTDYAYLDYCEGKPPREPDCMVGYLPLKQVYAFEPVPASLTPEQARHILGGQANLWTEYVTSTEQTEAKYWPRALAVADVTWAPSAARDWNGFQQRMGAQLATLDRLKVHYRIPEVRGLEADVLSLQPKTTLALSTPIPGATIRYTTDGSEPTAQSPQYTGPIELALVPTGTQVNARAFLADGRSSVVSSANFRQATLRPAAKVDARKLQAGLNRRYYEGSVLKVAGLETLPVVRADVAPAIAIPEQARPEAFGLRFDGYLRVSADAIYRFVLDSDDGSVLRIDGETVIDRDGGRSPGESYGSAALSAGLHRIDLDYFQGGGGRSLGLKIGREGEAPQAVAADALLHARN